MNKFKKNQTGQSLIEVLVAITIVALIILGIIKATSISVKDENYSQDQSTATSLAQSKMSEITAQKNLNPKTFFSTPPSPDEELVEEHYCRKSSVVSDGSTASILVSVFWGENGDGADCDGKDYLYNYELNTDVTNQ